MNTTTPAASVHPSSRGNEILIFSAFFLTICWIVVFLRMYVRYFMMNHIAADDVWMFLAMVAYTGYSANNMYGIVDGGTGQHLTDLTIEKLYVGLKAWFISEVMYGPVSAMVRTSVAIFLLRLCELRWHRWIIIANLAVIWFISIGFTAACTFQCDPPGYFYDRVLGREGNCVNPLLVPYATIAHSVLAATCDFVFAALPILMLWNVRLNKRTKSSVAFMLGLGFISGVALLVRIPYIRILLTSDDFLYETVDVAIWTIAEPSLGIIAGCLATLRPLLKGFSFGQNTLATTIVTGGASRRTAATNDKEPTPQLQKPDEFCSPSYTAEDIPLTSQACRTGSGSRQRATSESSLGSEYHEFHRANEPAVAPQPSICTTIVGSREPWKHGPKDCGSESQRIIVHTSILTETTYPGRPGRG